LSLRELAEWTAYYGLEPFGAARDNLHAGIVAATAANIMGAKAKPGDFMLETTRPKQQTPQDMMAMCRMIHTHLGGK